MNSSYDLIVVGAGSGGLVVATTANRRGLKVAMLEKHKIGGECTHSGCVPSKALIQSTKQLHALHDFPKYGLPEMEAENISFAAVMESVDRIVQGIYAHEKPEVWIKQGIDTYVHSDGAKFLDAHTVQIGPDVLKTKHVVICTGSAPRMLGLPGSEQIDFLHNENFWDLRKQPKSIAFIGGGIIAAEIGQSLARLGTEVHIFDRNHRILKVLDDEVADVILDQLKKEGLQSHARTSILGFRQEAENDVVLYEQDGEEKFLAVEKIFLTVGRKPNTAGMDLEKAGVEYDSRGIVVNEFMQTTTPNIYACGDVTTPQKFTHVAAHQANICVDNIQHGNRIVNDLSILPWGIFTDPEIAHVGMSEREARKRYGDKIQVFKVNATVDRFLTDQKTTGFLKVIFGENDQVLGADAIGAHAGEWTQLITLVMRHNIKPEDFIYTIFSYPTYSEIVKKVFTRYLRTKL
ncbi:MAG: FAD-dependent oxidoreductase [Bacteroidota bacterium]